VTVIAVATWRGVGATTSALLLAAAGAAFGEASWLIEADPGGGVLSARIPGLEAQPGSGIEALAFASDPDSGTIRDRFRTASRRLGQTSVVTGSADSFQAWSALASARVNWIGELGRIDGVVVVDVGSLRGGPAPSWRIIEQADALVMCTTPDPASLVSTVAWMDAKGQSAPGVGGLTTDTTKLLVVDAPIAGGERFGADVAGELGERFAGWWPWEPRTVDLVMRGASLDHKSLRKATLVRSVNATMGQLLDATGGRR
jgi:MinD-like ATPase involved in chromosome partitioning or flagellar assembly